MSKRVVLVTGGSRGIGAETAVLAASRGWDVCISYNSNKEEANKVIDRIKSEGSKALAVQANVGVEENIVSLFQEVDKHFGRLDALVNNAGIITKQSRLVEMDAARVRNVMNINVVGTFVCSREAIKRMSNKDGGLGGVIINLSSVASRIGSPNDFIDYASSKGAIDTMTYGLAKEVAEDGIRVNAVRPGLIKTDLHADAGDKDRPEKLKNFIPMKRSGSAIEVANLIVWLLSEEASYVNGALVDVSGGR